MDAFLLPGNVLRVTVADVTAPVEDDMPPPGTAVVFVGVTPRTLRLAKLVAENVKALDRLALFYQVSPGAAIGSWRLQDNPNYALVPEPTVMPSFRQPVSISRLISGEFYPDSDSYKNDALCAAVRAAIVALQGAVRSPADHVPTRRVGVCIVFLEEPPVESDTAQLPLALVNAGVQIMVVGMSKYQLPKALVPAIFASRGVVKGVSLAGVPRAVQCVMRQFFASHTVVIHVNCDVTGVVWGWGCHTYEDKPGVVVVANVSLGRPFFIDLRLTESPALLQVQIGAKATALTPALAVEDVDGEAMRMQVRHTVCDAAYRDAVAKPTIGALAYLLNLD